MGIMASVLVSLTTVALSSTLAPGCMLSQALVVDGGAGKQAKALVGQPEHTAERRKHERRDNVKQEDDRNSLGNLAIVGIDDGRGRGDGRTAAN